MRTVSRFSVIFLNSNKHTRTGNGSAYDCNLMVKIMQNYSNNSLLKVTTTKILSQTNFSVNAFNTKCLLEREEDVACIVHVLCIERGWASPSGINFPLKVLRLSNLGVSKREVGTHHFRTLEVLQGGPEVADCLVPQHPLVPNLEEQAGVKAVELTEMK